MNEDYKNGFNDALDFVATNLESSIQELKNVLNSASKMDLDTEIKSGILALTMFENDLREKIKYFKSGFTAITNRKTHE